MREGIIQKGIGGFYDILSQGEIFRCRARGRFRKLGLTPMVGDYVRFIPETEITEGSLEEILPRKNNLKRPPVANIDNLAIVIAPTQPDPDFFLVDKLMITAEKLNIKTILIINKIDLVEQESLNYIIEDYLPTNYKIHLISSKLGYGIEELSNELQGITTLAGQSGVGKSSIINRIHPGTNLKTGSVSKKLQQGRHTTRQVELLSLPGGGMIVDTPGFSQIEITDLEPEDLQDYYPEYVIFKHDCYFQRCTHTAEPYCKVREAIENGRLPKNRYERYKYFIEEIKEKRRNLW
ncbi:MAG: ribosome small subunit-dependent GTPase A [Clostridiales bacterium]|jgi:ribosome biogenesis GTPase|nr:ribosome small subunit-dependent GTPase A [Clostridiales bacterium]